ncbi:hypothetical protein BN2497_8271 [Janthinobacterium sp. CG23_2]|nr:hypothetical protein BN2497_8271 [Janthinobacterium sp. CG23_2]CUU30533.1 hypothetical protein BN3177_8271 [Janthinobacterium sp. CG23_2]
MFYRSSEPSHTDLNEKNQKEPYQQNGQKNTQRLCHWLSY